ncbi:hypothetical protein Phi40:1_gp066 [Cellulophaga phage phi40:1]|uniref:Uncharacterized protein n=1 Tax=Cellulophaga phage phi38:1 TaxID=1327977 RepID=R9ZYA2_9CAUD|nr:hypothetical protein Phi38:1_gp066 [Cellulophaga phage phi38:1]AGO47931.1 hypothetical protein Phi40:1_gp066 [Cellulophaga phage phi40:1]AGO48096.1 hypothetical protein Phi38:1_gp066 [Cellulophaga phage phi38:1]
MYICIKAIRSMKTIMNIATDIRTKGVKLLGRSRVL